MRTYNAKHIETLIINRRQKRFYNDKVVKTEKSNLVMNAWAHLRSSVYSLWSQIGIRDEMIQFHREWLSDLSGRRVLDLGCNKGNALSQMLAVKSAFYLGVDLSNLAIEQLREKLLRNNVENAEVKAIDFLDPNFTDDGFDVIYAHSVLHHFKDFELLLSILNKKLAPGGKVITYDPMETSISAWCVRKIYRPFQSNADWEYPFSKQSVRMIEKYFIIEEIQGVVGFSKWIIPFVFLPFMRKFTIRVGKLLHCFDLKYADKKGWPLWSCISVGMCLRRKEAID